MKIKNLYKSYGDLIKAKKELEESSNSNFIIKDSKNIEDPILYDIYRYKYATFVCKHAGEFKPRGNGQRLTSSWKRKCEAKFSIKFNKDINYLIVSRINLEHNHGHDELIYKSHNQEKLNLYELKFEDRDMEVNNYSLHANIAKEDPVVDDENSLLSPKFPSTKFITINTNQQLCDDHTISEEKQLLATFERIKNINGLTIEIYLESNNLLSVYFETNEMRFYFDTYPDVLMIDNVTYNDDSTITLYLLLVVDGKGIAQIVGIWIILYETPEMMAQMCELFKKYNVNWTKTQVIILEKDPHNIDIYQKAFPHAQIEISSAHIHKTCKRDIMSLHCVTSTEQIKVILDILKSMTECDTTEAFEQLLNIIYKLNLPTLNLYLQTLWLPSKSLWCPAYRTIKLSGILFHVIGRKGGYMQNKLRPAIIHYSTFARFLEDVVSFSDMLANKRDYDATMLCIKRRNNIQVLNTPEYRYSDLLLNFGYELVVKELIEHKILDINDILGNFSLQLTTNSCDCTFYNAFHLPCRHIFALRKATNMNLYDEGLCDERWKLNYFKRQRKLYIIKSQENKLDNKISNEDAIQPVKIEIQKETYINSIKKYQEELETLYKTFTPQKLSQYKNHYAKLLILAKKGGNPPTI